MKDVSFYLLLRLRSFEGFRITLRHFYYFIFCLTIVQLENFEDFAKNADMLGFPNDDEEVRKVLDELQKQEARRRELLEVQWVATPFILSSTRGTVQSNGAPGDALLLLS